MPLFRKKKEDDDTVYVSQRPEHTKKLSSADINDPILTAIHSEQPFEVSNMSTTVQMSPEGNFRDIFGGLIQSPDRSNPTRARDERPLDTIRTFEFSCTGDDRLRDEMETPRLGWNTRTDFASIPRFTTNPYAANSMGSGAGATPGSNVISFGGGDSAGAGYQRPLMTAPVEDKKKKKRGLFGRKKG